MELITKYPAFIAVVISVLSVAFTILFAKNSPNRYVYLSDMMLNDLVPRISMTVGMMSTAILAPLTIVQFNYLVDDSLKLFSYLVVIASGFFLITPILLWLNQYSMHLVTIRVYLIMMFGVQLLMIGSVGDYKGIFAIIFVLNVFLTVYFFVRSKIGWLSEVSFSLMTLSFLIALNLMTLEIL